MTDEHREGPTWCRRCPCAGCASAREAEAIDRGKVLRARRLALGLRLFGGGGGPRRMGRRRYAPLLGVSRTQLASYESGRVRVPEWALETSAALLHAVPEPGEPLDHYAAVVNVARRRADRRKTRGFVSSRKRPSVGRLLRAARR